MPQDDPGTLTPKQSVDLVAFLLSFNKFLAGKTELPPENEPLAKMRFIAKEPDSKGGSNKLVVAPGKKPVRMISGVAGIAPPMGSSLPSYPP